MRRFVNRLTKDNNSGARANRLSSTRLGIALIVVALLLSSLSACGPERGRSAEVDIDTETIRIAQDYAQDRNLDAARTRLQALNVANSMQWLVYMAETAVDSEPSDEHTRALADLAINMGSQSHELIAYGEQIGLIEAQDSEEAVTGDTTTEDALNVDPMNEEAAALETVETAVQAAQAVMDTPEPIPTVAVIQLVPTLEAEAPSATPEPVMLPTATPIPIPLALASTSMNVRSGPGTVYPIMGALETGEEAEIVAKNAESDWWQVKLGADQLGWVYGQLVSATGNLENVAVASNIPEPPPTPVPAPVVEVAEQQPAEEAPAQEMPAEEAPAEAPVPSGPDFKVIERRLWDVYENGGRLDGASVICGEKRQLVVNVLDANGNRLNGVAVQAEFGAKEIFVTGSQGKGDGVVEFILGEGQDVRVIRDADGREVSSEVARGMVTKPAGISYEDLIGAQYCTNDADCRTFVDAPGCWGHYSWTVTFQRNY